MPNVIRCRNVSEIRPGLKVVRHWQAVVPVGLGKYTESLWLRTSSVQIKAKVGRPSFSARILSSGASGQTGMKSPNPGPCGNQPMDWLHTKALVYIRDFPYLSQLPSIGNGEVMKLIPTVSRCPLGKRRSDNCAYGLVL